jgi:Holliday junction resolvase RusA-like endonuclease
MRSISFTAFGLPAPKGSMRAAGNNVIPSGSPQNRANLANWQGSVRQAAVDAIAALGLTGTILFIGVPMKVTVIWRMKRPMGHFAKKGPSAGQLLASAPKYHITPPDSSKLLRATEDDLQGLVFGNDSCIAETLMRKVYAMPGSEGAWIKIEELENK